MITEELVKYIKNSLEKNQTKEEIKRILIENGWKTDDVEESFSYIKNQLEHDIVPIPPTTQPLVNNDIEPIKVLKSSQIMKVSFAFFKEKYISILVLSLPPYFIYYFLFEVIAPWLVINIPILNSNSIAFYILQLILTIIAGATSAFFYLSLLYLIKNKDLNLKSIILISKSNIFTYWLLVITIGLLSFLGLFFFLIPGLIFMIWSFFVPYIFVDQNLHGIQAINKSKFYALNQWKNISKKVLYILMFNIIFLIFVLVINLILKPEDIIETIINGILWGFASAISTIYFFNFYSNVKTFKNDADYIASPKNKTIYNFVLIMSVFLLVFVLFFAFKEISKSKSTPLIPTNSSLQQKIPINTFNQPTDSYLILEITGIESAVWSYYANNQISALCDINSPNNCETINVPINIKKTKFLLNNLISTNQVVSSFEQKESLNDIYIQNTDDKNYLICYQQPYDKRKNNLEEYQDYYELNSNMFITNTNGSWLCFKSNSIFE